MPWHVEDDNPECSGYAVVKDSDGEIEGCHDTREKANAQLAALYASEESAMPDAPDEEVRTAPPAEGWRAISWPAEYREEPDRPPRLVGHFARFGVFNEIDSAIEGRFLERIEPTAFNRTFKNNRDRIRVLFQHGKDPDLGEKPIASVTELRADATGPYYEAELLDGIPPLIADGLRKGVYGVSYRFQVVDDHYEPKPAKSPANPRGLPERTIREAKVFEFGPVTFPADPGADIAVRSLTDAMRPNTLPEPVAPSLEPAADAPHPEPEARDEPVVVAAIQAKETSPVEYTTRDEKASRLAELKEIIERTGTAYPGEMPIDVRAEWDSNNAEHDQLVRDIRAWDERVARIESIRKTDSVEGPYSAPTIIRAKSIEDIYDVRSIETSTRTPEDRAQALRDNAFRSLDSAPIPKGASIDGLARFLDNEQYDQDESGRLHQEATRRVLLTGNPQYRRAFAKYLRDGNDRGFTPEESRAAALAVTGTTTTGGYAVPYVFDPTIIRIGAHTAINPYRAACRVETISGGNNWKAVTVGAITAKWDTEAAASVEGGPTFGQPDFTVQRADAFATVSIETLQDRPDATAELTAVFGEAKDTLEENSFTLGTGATVYPFGMFRTLAFTNLDTATNDVTAIGDLTRLEADLPLRHRMNAAFFMSRSTQRQLEALDTTGYYFKRPGQYFAAGSAAPQNVPTGNTGTQLLGYPVWEVPSAVSTLTTDGAIIVVFGDPRSYCVVDRVGMNVEVVPLMLNGATPSFPTGQRGVYCYWRGTARPLNVDGMRSLSVQ